MTAHILVVDDESGIRDLLEEILRDEGYAVTLAENATAARAARQAARPDLVLLDIWMPDTDGVTLLKEWARSGQLDMPVVMMSGHATIDTAVEATRIGAAEFLEKPIALARLLETVQRQLKRQAAPADDLLAALAAASPAFARAREQVAALLQREQPVLLVGSPGAAFEAFLPMLHRPQAPWVAVERQARLAEAPTELVEQAAGGTLWVPDLAALSRLEARGLAILAARCVQSGVRLVVGSSADPARLLADGRIEATAFSAIASGRVDLPAVRHADHAPDGLADALLPRLSAAAGRDGMTLPARVRAAIAQAAFPGDFAELKALLERLIASGEDAVEWERLPAIPAPSEADFGAFADWFGQPLREARDAFEKAYFEHHLQRFGGQVSALAEHVGLERTHLYRKLRQLGIRSKDGDK